MMVYHCCPMRVTQHAPCITLEYDCTCTMPRTSTIPTLLGCTTLSVCISTTRTASTPVAECTTSGCTAHTPGTWHQTDLTVRRLALHHTHTLTCAHAHAAALTHAVLTCALALSCAL